MHAHAPAVPIALVPLRQVARGARLREGGRSTRPRTCAVAGRSGNTIGRFPRKNGRCSRENKAPGFARERRRDRIRGDSEEEIKDPLVLEFLGLKDEYLSTDLEEALIRHLEMFLLELGQDFALRPATASRIGDEWYRIDLLFTAVPLPDGHRPQTGKFSAHAHVGQMHLHFAYAKKHGPIPQNPP